jgi:tRNA1(Val) A37 N6-methylase TrmN6
MIAGRTLFCSGEDALLIGKFLLAKSCKIVAPIGGGNTLT